MNAMTDSKMTSILIPRIVIAGTSSGSGKTTIVTGLLASLRKRGLCVQAYKIGPDYIDPGYHRIASERDVHNLDSWLFSQNTLKELLAKTASDADIAVIEGVMGLHDGGREGISSTAEIAKLLNAPVLLVIDAKSMGASAAAIALGFQAYDQDVQLEGVLLNRLGSSTHIAMVKQAMEHIRIPVLGAMRRREDLHLPERHLGLLPTEEHNAIDTVGNITEAVETQVDVDAVLNIAKKAPPLIYEQEIYSRSILSHVKKVRIAVARDAAFSFYYPESLAMMESYGAELVEFSPLEDACVPESDAILIGGGFPEMFAEDLAKNEKMKSSIYELADQGMPVYAECGGYMYLMEELLDFDGVSYSMVGVFPTVARMTSKLQMVGYVQSQLLLDSVLGLKGDTIQGHEFHFSIEESTSSGRTNKDAVRTPFTFTRLRDGKQYLAGQMYKNTIGSYLHLHFAGCPKVAETFVRIAKNWR